MKPKLPAPENVSAAALLASTEASVATPAVAPAPGRAPEELAAQGRKVQFAALTIGAIGIILFAGVGYVAYSGQLDANDQVAAEESMDFTDEEDDESATAVQPDASAPSAPVATALPTSPVATASAVVPAPALASDVSNAPDVAPAPSLEFRTYVANLRIRGVRSGSNPRVLIDRNSYNLGATINEELGITFAGYDAERHLVRFKDSTGAIVDRRDR